MQALPGERGTPRSLVAAVGGRVEAQQLRAEHTSWVGRVAIAHVTAGTRHQQRTATILVTILVTILAGTKPASPGAARYTRSGLIRHATWQRVVVVTGFAVQGTPDPKPNLQVCAPGSRAG